MDLSKLKTPFPATDIEWRIQSCGETKDGKVWAKCLAYVTNRAIMDRLDEVCGPGAWSNEFQKGPEGGILCGISICVTDAYSDDRLTVPEKWVTKWDGAENTDIESVKGGLSSAMKRAAVQWGIGRYLYNLEEGWAVITDSGRFIGKTKSDKSFKWNPPALPQWALPSVVVPKLDYQTGQASVVPPRASETTPPSKDQLAMIDKLSKELRATVEKPKTYEAALQVINAMETKRQQLNKELDVVATSKS